MARFKSPYLFPYRFVVAAAFCFALSGILALILWAIQ